MKYWLNAGFLEADAMVAVAHLAERLGYEGIALPDHLFLPEQIDSDYPYTADGEVAWVPEVPWPDCWVAIAAMAQRTERLRFTTGVFVAPLRDVFDLAKSIATAAGFAPGRLSCGFGAGWMREEFDTVGQDFATRGPRMDEMLAVMPQLWSGELVEFHGEHIDFAPLRMRPPAHDVAVLIGGNTKPALRRAAGQDGWIASYTDVDDVARMLDDLTRQRERAGRLDRPFETLVTATPGAARDAASLEALGVDGVIVPVIALAPSPALDDVVAGIERFADRWMR